MFSQRPKRMTCPSDSFAPELSAFVTWRPWTFQFLQSSMRNASRLPSPLRCARRSLSARIQIGADSVPLRALPAERQSMAGSPVVVGV